MNGWCVPGWACRLYTVEFQFSTFYCKYGPIVKICSQIDLQVSNSDSWHWCILWIWSIWASLCTRHFIALKYAFIQKSVKKIKPNLASPACMQFPLKACFLFRKKKFKTNFALPMHIASIQSMFDFYLPCIWPCIMILFTNC